MSNLIPGSLHTPTELPFARLGSPVLMELGTDLSWLEHLRIRTELQAHQRSEVGALDKSHGVPSESCHD
jgi:hypothetical protein